MIRNMIAFDLGASNGRAILGRFDGEKLVMTELHRFENNYIEMNGVFYWDTPYLYSQLKQGLLAFRQGGFGELDSFGIDTWGVDYGLLDKNGHLAGVPRSYRLGVQADVDAVTAKIPAETLYARSGIDPSLTFNTLYQLCRRQREGDAALAAADRLLLTPDLLGYFLTGAAGTEYTIATTTQLYNPTARDWDWATIDELGLPRHIFTEIQPSGTVRGHLRPELCEELGLRNISKTITAEEFFDVLPAVQYYADEPNANLSTVPLYFLSQLAARDVKVVLSGEGADELFGGYITYHTTKPYRA